MNERPCVSLTEGRLLYLELVEADGAGLVVVRKTEPPREPKHPAGPDQHMCNRYAGKSDGMNGHGREVASGRHVVPQVLVQ